MIPENLAETNPARKLGEKMRPSENPLLPRPCTNDLLGPFFTHHNMIVARKTILPLLAFGAGWSVPLDFPGGQAFAGQTRPAPIFNQSAATAQSIAVDANFKYFQGVQLEEADRFDGVGFDFEAFVPFRENLQVRMILPAYTNGRARLLDPPTKERIRIKGPGGTFDYPTLLLDHQIRGVADDGFNLSYFLGFGMTVGSWGKLNTTHGDTYNHQGHLYRLGLKADHVSPGGAVHWFGNAGLRVYLGSDDLNPSVTGDDFTLLEAGAGAVFHSFQESVQPALELTLTTDIDRYFAAHAVPQLIFPLAKNLEVKAGVPLRLSRDGEHWGIRIQLSARL